jgi:uncharacterized protein (DUF2147 family)
MSIRLIAPIASALVAGAICPSALSATEAPLANEAHPLAMKYPPDAIVGEWCTQREENRPPGRVKFAQGPDGTYMGVLTWSADPKRDVNNKDPKLRDRPLVGIVLMWHLRYDDGEYVDGYVYNPEDGGTYRVKAEVLSPESLKIRGYLGISLLGQSKTWSRYQP